MQHAEVLHRVDKILKEAGFTPKQTSLASFLDKARLTADVIKDWPQDRKEKSWVIPFLKELRKMEGEFSKIVEKDPMILYKPAHKVALDFHKSNAFIRYYYAANRTSKTNSGYAEDYMVATGQHRWRNFNKQPTSVFVIGVNFSKYGPSVFEKKMLIGEPDNILSPIFPVGGKWLYKYDERKHIIYIACTVCAEEGTAQSCPHPKSTITLFSDTEGFEVLQGGQYNLGHFDEHVGEEFYDEARQRLKTVSNSGLIVTGTPLFGKSSWEYKRLYQLGLNKKENRMELEGKEVPIVDLFTISQYDAGLVPKKVIDADLKMMDPLEAEARIYGRPAPLAKSSVFDRYVMHEMEKDAVDPEYGETTISKSIEEIQHSKDVRFRPTLDGDLRVWQTPELGKQYIIGADVAAGLAHGDYSCASVLTLPDLEMVAQYHGHINPLRYAEELLKLCTMYNSACLVVERTGGLGVATLTRLKELGYWNLFRDMTDPSAANFSPDAVLGVDTNIKTKGHMISCMQQAVKEKQIKIPCAQTLEEMRAFGQEITESKLTYRFRGESGAHDDRVMSLVVAVYVAVTQPVFDFASDLDRLKSPGAKHPIWKDLHRELDQEERIRRGAWN